MRVREYVFTGSPLADTSAAAKLPGVHTKHVEHDVNQTVKNSNNQ